jgi:hypothetical protein
MKELTLDGAGWVRKGDVYSAFFHVVGAPEWHGRNFEFRLQTPSAPSALPEKPSQFEPNQLLILIKRVFQANGVEQLRSPPARYA